jgi:hypothetical protein
MSESRMDRGNDRGNGLVARLSSMLRHVRQVMLERSRHSKPRRMVLLEALQLGNRRQLFLVACDEHRFLVGAGSDRIGTLVAIPETASTAAPDASSVGVRSQARMQRADAVRGREPAWMRPRAFAGTEGSRLELVPRDSVTVNHAATRNGLEAGRTQ